MAKKNPLGAGRCGFMGPASLKTGLAKVLTEG